MKLTTDRQALAEALAWVSAAVPKRPPVPTLAGVKLTAVKGKGKKPGELTIAAFDYETSHVARIPAEVEEAGVTIPSGHLLKSLVSALRGKDVALAAENNGMSLVSGRSRYSLATFPIDQYPTAPEPPTAAGSVEAEDLQRMLRAAGYACDDDYPNSDMRGVRLQVADARLILLGTMSTSIAASWVDWSGDVIDAHLPHAALSAAVAGLSGSVALAYDGNVLGLSSADRVVVTRVYAGTKGAAAWQKLVPTKTTVEATIDGVELLEAVKRATLAGGPGEPVRVRFAPEGIRVSAASDLAQGAEELDVSSGEGELTLAFSAGLLGDALSCAPPGEVTLRGTTEGKPISVTNKADDFVQVIMPRRAS